ncbi:MAG: hypothetical protein R2789_05600 [Microthrixaceae bacterium]
MECPEEAPEDLSTLDPLCRDIALRKASLEETTARILAVQDPSIADPDFANFLLYQTENPDGGGEVRKALLPFFPDDTHALTITRLSGNLSIEDEGIASAEVVEVAQDLEFPNASVVTTGAPVLLNDINDYLRGGMVSLGAIALAVMA